MFAIRVSKGSPAERVDVGTIAAAAGPALFLIPQQHAEELVGRRGFVDRNTKHPRRDLASYLLRGKGDRIPVLRAGYRSSGQLKRGVDAFLERLSQRGIRTVAVLAVPEEILQAAYPLEPETHSNSTFAGVFGYDAREKEIAGLVQGSSEAMVEVRLKILRAAARDLPVLITGHTGTGKTHIARIIHDERQRRMGAHAPFIEVNCASIPSELLESELFGHRKGSFTHATYDKQGLWAAAGEGTLFLDEIGDLRLEHQAKVLQAIQEGRIRPLGATREITVGARIITATNRSLELLLRDGTFRQDLYYRVSGFTIEVPDLDNHIDDIPLLANHFWSLAAANSAPLTPEVLAYLRSVKWPGNVRMLKRCLEVAHSLIPQGASPTLEQIEYVLRSFAPILPQASKEGTEHAATIYLSECLIHLRRLDAVTAGLRRSMDQSDGASPRNTRRKLAESGLITRRGELESLLRSPVLLHSHALTRQARLLAEDLERLKADSTEAARESIRKRLSRVEGLMFREVDEAVRELAKA
jgi:transcriptional regulator with GAF, ATPase, and Fis domain